MRRLVRIIAVTWCLVPWVGAMDFASACCSEPLVAMVEIIAENSSSSGPCCCACLACGCCALWCNALMKIDAAMDAYYQNGNGGSFQHRLPECAAGHCDDHVHLSCGHYFRQRYWAAVKDKGCCPVCKKSV